MSVLSQILFNVLYSALLFTLLGLSFDVLYRTARFFHFAHGSVVLFGAYLGYVVSHQTGHLWIGVLAGICVAAAVNVALELSVFARLRAKGSSALSLLIVSLGIYVVMQNLISLWFGDGTRVLMPSSSLHSFALLGVYATPVQLITVITAIIIVVLLIIGFRYSGYGKAIRAASCDSELAASLGLPINKIYVAAFAISAALGAIATFFVGMDSGIYPGLGLHLLLIAVVVMIVGGVGSLWGAAFGGLIIALAQSAAVWWISSVWQDAVTFGVLLLFLLFRPQGIMGRRSREEST